MDEFTLGSPEIVCRWRLFDRALPLESRHLRALAARTTSTGPLSPALLGWAKQHLEWTLESGAAQHPDGVLMLLVDTAGKAAMTIGEYEPLEHTSANDLLRRAQSAQKEAQATRVSPEDLWIVSGEDLVWGTSSEFAPSGASSLIADLARTLGMSMQKDETLLRRMSTQGFVCDEVFLVSDEHGVVPASDHAGMRAQKFADAYHKLFKRK